MPHSTIQPSGAIVYRTVLMEMNRAAAFARCIGGNTHFRDVEISDPRGKRGKRFVSFRPTSSDRQGVMYQHQMDIRAARAANEGEDYIFWPDPDCRGSYWVFNPLSGETYQVTPFNCTCPDYEVRCRKAALHCKHMAALQLQADAQTLGRTDKVTETPDQRRARILRQIEVDF